MTAGVPALYELRVVRGNPCGAAAPVAVGVPIRIGEDFDNDVVLHDEQDDPVRITLTLKPQREDAIIELHIEQGVVRSGDRTWRAGDIVNVPLYGVIQLGHVELVVGRVGAAQWTTVFQPGGPSGRRPSDENMVSQSRGTARTSWVQRLVMGGLALMVASLGMLALASAVAPDTPLPSDQAHRVQALLQAHGFTGLSVRSGEAGVVVSGYLDTVDQRARAEQILMAEGLRVHWKLWVNEQVVSSVREVYRLHGMPAEVTAVGPGIVRVQTEHSSPARVEHIESIVRRDVPGVHELKTSNTLPAREPSPIPAVNDPGKRVAAVVPGDPSYVVTADGTRYFEGALLPTGHRIVSIEGEAVQLEREGQSSALRF